MTRIRIGGIEARMNPLGHVHDLALRNNAWRCNDAELQRRLNKDLALVAESALYQPDWHAFAAERAVHVFGAEILELPPDDDTGLDEDGNPIVY